MFYGHGGAGGSGSNSKPGSGSGDSRGGGPGSGNRGGAGTGNKNDRFEQMSKQQELIQQKKREIEAKIEAERQRKAMELLLGANPPPPPPPMIPTSPPNSNSGPGVATVGIGSSLSASTTTASSTKSSSGGLDTSEETADTKPKLIFSNDGSFFEQFKRLQEQQKKEKEAPVVPKVELLDETDEYGNPINRKPLIKIINPTTGSGSNSKGSAAIPPPSIYEDPYAPPPPPPIPPPNNHIKAEYEYPNQRQREYSHPPNQRGLLGNYHDVPPPPPPPGPYLEKSNPPGFPSQPVKDLAADVAEKGDLYEETVNKNNNPLLWFLNRPDSEEYRRYRDLVLKLRSELPVKAKINNPTPVPPALKRQNSDDSDDSAKKRRSRWGPQSSQLPSPSIAALPPPGLAIPQVPVIGLGLVPGGVPPPMPLAIGQAQLPGLSRPGPPSALSKVTRTNPQLLAYARQAYGTMNLDEEQWKQCEEAYKMNLLFQDIARKKAKDEKLAQAGKFKHEYDSDEEVDDHGTWEHKKRLQEMEKTRDWASELTHNAKGKHHIGDFLPPEELAKFMDKYKAVKEGNTMTESAYQDFKIAQDNVGFKLLQKMGWSDGQGLGATGQGIAAPIESGNTSVDNAGLGLENPSDVKGDDDEYSAYRKRMMLAYRFRPNPLNNPRRAYY